MTSETTDATSPPADGQAPPGLEETARRPAPTEDPGMDPRVPPVPESIEETGLSPAFVSDLIVKTLYVQGSRDGGRLESSIKLPFALLDDELLTLQQRRLVEVRGAQGHGRRGYTFDLTGEGRGRARELLQQSRYVGPAPVPLDRYWQSVEAQTTRDLHIDREKIRDGFRHLVFDEAFMDALGPAINSGRSVFLYGHAGNGKTSIAEAVAAMLGGSIYIPHTLEVEGQIVSLYDPVSHREMEGEPVGRPDQPYYLRTPPAHDQRFVRVKRPVVMVGGELTLDELELQFDEQTGVFRAPPQLKANGGVFVIDDFGRQRVRPRDLLNRWMIPLDRHMDYLNLPMGHKLPVPFDCLLIFATNLDPSELVEEAFLRRIQYKILVDSPTRGQYEEIWRRTFEGRGLPFRPEDVDFVWTEYYEERGLPARACHPRDVANHLQDIARYSGVDVEVSPERLRQACDTYFLEEPTNGSSDGPSMSASWMRGRFDG